MLRTVHIRSDQRFDDYKHDKIDNVKTCNGDAKHNPRSHILRVGVRITPGEEIWISEDHDI